MFLKKAYKMTLNSKKLQFNKYSLISFLAIKVRIV